MKSNFSIGESVEFLKNICKIKSIIFTEKKVYYDLEYRVEKGLYTMFFHIESAMIDKI